MTNRKSPGRSRGFLAWQKLLLLSFRRSRSTNELAGGEPIYESLAGRMQTKEDNDYVGEADQLTFSVFEGSQMAGKKIKEIAWPDRTLVKVIHRGQKDIIPDGNTQLVVGDLVVLELDENQRGVIYDEVARLQNEK